MIRCAISIGAVLLCGSALAAESYLCVADLAVGFSYDKVDDRWVKSNFRTDSKYVFSKSPGGVWQVKQVGQSLVDAECGTGFYKNGNLICNGLTQYRMNKNNGRYLAVYPFGYWNTNKKAKQGELWQEGEDTPSIEIGKCSPL